MRLINAGPGEMADRLTILALKVLHGAEKGRDTKHFLDERNALLTALRGREITGSWLEHLLELAATNAALWYAEDELRDWRQQWQPTGPDSTSLRGPGEGFKAATALEVVACAFRIQSLNDRRAELVQAINQATGDHLGSEKL